MSSGWNWSPLSSLGHVGFLGSAEGLDCATFLREAAEIIRFGWVALAEHLLVHVGGKVKKTGKKEEK